MDIKFKVNDRFRFSRSDKISSVIGPIDVEIVVTGITIIGNGQGVYDALIDFTSNGRPGRQLAGDLLRQFAKYEAKKAEG